jgi:hypothetical protein
MFSRASRRVRFEPKEGDRIEVLARVCLYEARGDLQLAMKQMRQTRAGADLRDALVRAQRTLLEEASRNAQARRARSRWSIRDQCWSAAIPSRATAKARCCAARGGGSRRRPRG